MPDNNRPSWLSFIGHAKDSLWRIVFFRCRSILLNTHWVLVVMDQFTRRIIGFGVHAGDVDGITLCRMFNSAILTKDAPKYICSDNAPLFLYHHWQANLRIQGTDTIKAFPYTPISHPFVERLTGTIRREYLDHTLFWNARDLNENLARFYSITTILALISLSMGTHPLKLVTSINNKPQNSATNHGYHTAMDIFRRQLLHEQEFATYRCALMFFNVSN
jgi:putative transposase